MSKGLVQSTFGVDPDFENKFDSIYENNEWGDAAFSVALLNPSDVLLKRPDGGDPM